MLILQDVLSPFDLHQGLIWMCKVSMPVFLWQVAANVKVVLVIQRLKRRSWQLTRRFEPGIPAIRAWWIIANRYPQLLFHDDNEGMIGVVRSGRNPTMRHMERTHGISIASLHEHFQRDHFVLIYEITAKMAADIRTKGFKNPMAWKRALYFDPSVGSWRRQ